MKRFIALFSFISAFLGCAFQSQATHIIGGELYYEAVAPGIFIATYREYYSVSANIPVLPATKDFNLRSPGCNNGKVVSGTAQTGATLMNINGGTANNCSSGFPNSVFVATYTATITINNNYLTCPDWYISVQECSRAATANLPASQSHNACLFVAAYLNVVHASLQTRSPAFLLPQSWIFGVNAPATYSNLTVQNMNQQDSVAYSLKPALNDHNSPLAYSANTSFTQPIPTSSGVNINAKTGLMSFTPNVFLSSSSLASNAYTIVVEAAVYRKINGKATKVSASQRNLPVYIVDNAGNANPELINVTANGQPVQPNEVVQVQSGKALTFQFSTADANTGDNLTLVLPDPQFAGFPANTTVNTAAGFRPSGTLTFNTTATATDQLFYFPVTVMDNACPARGVTTQVYGVKLLASPLSIQEQKQEVNFSAFPNPFTDAVSFRFSRNTNLQRILIFNLLGQPVDQIELSGNAFKEQTILWQNACKHAAGTYVAKLISVNKTVQTLKFTKVK